MELLPIYFVFAVKRLPILDQPREMPLENFNFNSAKASEQLPDRLGGGVIHPRQCRTP